MHKHGGDIYTNKNVIDFSANLNPLGMPPEVLNAAQNAVAKAYAYPDVSCRRLICAISEMECVNSGNIICGCGAAELIFALVFAVRPKRALLIAPCFEEYRQALNAVNCHISEYLLTEENDFELADDFLEFINEEINMLFICNPNNPTGKAVEKGLLLKIVDRCREKGVLIVADECFVNFLDKEKQFSLKGEEGVFLLKAFTKMYGMAGIRLGYGISTDIMLLKRIKECVQPWSVSVIAQEAGISACGCEDFVDKTRKLISREKEYLLKNIKPYTEKIYGSDGNFIFFKANEHLYDSLLKKEIMIRDCRNFRGLKEGFYRIAIKGHEDNERLITALAEVNNG